MVPDGDIITLPPAHMIVSMDVFPFESPEKHSGDCR